MLTNRRLTGDARSLTLESFSAAVNERFPRRCDNVEVPMGQTNGGDVRRVGRAGKAGAGGSRNASARVVERGQPYKNDNLGGCQGIWVRDCSFTAYD